MTKTGATGFSVHNDGLVMTCAHTFKGVNLTEINVRRLDEENFKTAKLKDMRLKWDLALLKVDEVIDCSVGEFADGSIWEGQPLLHIGNPCNFGGSYLIGRACFPCVADVSPPRGNETCGRFDSTAMIKTPRYRVMGHVWNSEYFSSHEHSTFPFEKSLTPSVPIIQCNGINARPGCSGGPVFNMEGKIVGMLIAGVDDFDIVTHVSALRMYLANHCQSEVCISTSVICYAIRIKIKQILKLLNFTIVQDTSKKQRTC